MRHAILVVLLLGMTQDVPFRVFPADNPWNWDVSRHAVHPDSDRIIASIGADDPLHPDFGTRYGIPCCVVSGRQKKVPVKFRYADESDPGPYPIPDDAPIEGGGDRHVLVVDRDNRILYELFDARKTGDGWSAGSGAIFDLTSNKLRPAGWTSADAAGLPIFPGLVRYEEAARGTIPHAIRFTASRTRKEYLWPARHQAGHGDDPSLPPMGLRLRLKAGFKISGFPQDCQVILRALQKHGMILADNGSDLYVTGSPHPKWNDEQLCALKRVKGSDFEVVRTVDEKGRPIPPPR